MNIVMFTNTYTPHVGGVARSVETFARAYRERGHRVLTVAPEFENMPAHEPDVIRIPAIQHFNGSDFSVALPVPGYLHDAIDELEPDIVHSHHPYLLGTAALRTARVRGIPLVFTHHTLYEKYTHYVPGDSEPMKRFSVALATHYAGLSNEVFAPSESIRELLRSRGVETPISVVPTGVDVAAFERGSGPGLRAAAGLPDDAFVVGHLGRLAPEKNIAFLAEAVARYLATDPRAHFLVVGSGPSAADIRRRFESERIANRLHMLGPLGPPLLYSAYQAMDVFAFASQSETQGLVLAESMAAGIPVVALDAPGAREVVRDRINGRLLDEHSVEAFADGIRWLAEASQETQRALISAATQTASRFSIEHTTSEALGHYQHLIGEPFAGETSELDLWEESVRLIRVQWDIIVGLASAVGAVFSDDSLELQ